MLFLKTYWRVLLQLGSDLRIAALLGVTSLALAMLQFIDPIHSLGL